MSFEMREEREARFEGVRGTAEEGREVEVVVVGQVSVTEAILRGVRVRERAREEKEKEKEEGERDSTRKWTLVLLLPSPLCSTGCLKRFHTRYKEVEEVERRGKGEKRRGDDDDDDNDDELYGQASARGGWEGDKRKREESDAPSSINHNRLDRFLPTERIPLPAKRLTRLTRRLHCWHHRRLRRRTTTRRARPTPPLPPTQRRPSPLNSRKRRRSSPLLLSLFLLQRCLSGRTRRGTRGIGGVEAEEEGAEGEGEG